MIFAMQVFYYMSLIFYELHPLSQDEFNPPTIQKVLMPKLKSKKNGKVLWEINSRCQEIFQGYLNPDIYCGKFDCKIPTFDIKATLEQMKKENVVAE